MCAIFSVSDIEDVSKINSTFTTFENVGAICFRTDEEGTIICESDGINIKFFNSRYELIN